MARTPKKYPRRIAAAFALAISIPFSVAYAHAVASDDVGAAASAPADVAPPDCPSASGGSPAGYDSVSNAEAKDLFDQTFACIVRSLGADQLSSASSSLADEATAVDPSSGSSATSMPPLRTTDGSPADLTVEPTSAGYTPVNPVVDLTLPADLGSPAAVGDRGIGVGLGATDPVEGASASGQQLGDRAVFYANAAPATDVMLAPIDPGLEAVYQLRSPESPESLRMGLTLPDGAALEPVNGGVNVIEDGQSVASFYAPLAIDANGKSVAATMSVNGEGLELNVSHSDPGIAYPIAVTTSMGSFAPAASGQAATVTAGMNDVGLSSTGPRSEAAMAANMNVKVVRYWMSWCGLEHTQGVYNSSDLQGVVNAVNNAPANGEKVLVEFTTSAPVFARTDLTKPLSFPCTASNPGAASIAAGPDNASAYATALRKIAWCLNGDSRCNENLDCSCMINMHGRMLASNNFYGFEVGNEPNTQDWWDNGANGTNQPGTITRSEANIYYGVLQRAVSQLHQYADNSNVTIKVSSAGLSYGSPDGHAWGEDKVDASTYLDQVLSNGNSGADAYAIHPYGRGLHPDMIYVNGIPVNANVGNDVGATRQVLASRGYSDTVPIWITEVGVDADCNDDGSGKPCADNNDVTAAEESRQWDDLYFTWWNSIRDVCSSWNVPLAVFWTFKDQHRYRYIDPNTLNPPAYYAGFAKMVLNPSPPPAEIVDYTKQAYAEFDAGNILASNTCTG
jgi:hypothetical protein